MACKLLILRGIDNAGRGLFGPDSGALLFFPLQQGKSAHAARGLLRVLPNRALFLVAAVEPLEFGNAGTLAHAGRKGFGRPWEGGGLLAPGAGAWATAAPPTIPLTITGQPRRRSTRRAWRVFATLARTPPVPIGRLAMPPFARGVTSARETGCEIQVVKMSPLLRLAARSPTRQPPSKTIGLSCHLNC